MGADSLEEGCGQQKPMAAGSGETKVGLGEVSLRKCTFSPGCG